MVLPSRVGLLALSGLVLAACDTTILDERSSVDSSSSTTSSVAGSGAGGGAGGSDAVGPPVAWPTGPDGPATRRCRADGSGSVETGYATPGRLALVPRADDYALRLVTSGWTTTSSGELRGTIEVFDESFHLGIGHRLDGRYADDAGTPASDDVLPFAARRDVTVHVNDAGAPQLVARVMAFELESGNLYGDGSLRSASHRAHALPAEQAPVHALGLASDGTALVAHGDARALRFSAVAFDQTETNLPPVVELLPAPIACADRPLATAFAPREGGSIIAVSTDGSDCSAATAGPADVVRTVAVDGSGAVVAESAIRLERPVEALWTTAQETGAWIAIRLEGDAALLVGRLGDDAVIEPIATLPAGEHATIANWRDGLVVADAPAADRIRIRHVDARGAVAAAFENDLAGAGASPLEASASPHGWTVLVAMFVNAPGSTKRDIRLRSFECEL